MMDGIAGYGHGAGGIIGLIFWIMLIVAIVITIRWLMGITSSNNTRPNRALDILNERYARGEIDQQEYQRIRREIIGNDD